MKKITRAFPFMLIPSERNLLKSLMATFFKGKVLENDESGEKIEVDADEVEKGILKQLYLQSRTSKIPQSRYRKIHKINFFQCL